MDIGQVRRSERMVSHLKFFDSFLSNKNTKDFWLPFRRVSENQMFKRKKMVHFCKRGAISQWRKSEAMALLIKT